MSTRVSEEQFRAAAATANPCSRDRMSTKNSTGDELTGTTRRIESSRLERALTESMTVEPHAPAMYDVTHDGETYTVDVREGSCGCKDHAFRGNEFVCKHICRACIHHAFERDGNTELVARVLARVKALGCVHDVAGCAGPTTPSERCGGLPCPECLEATGTDEWAVWNRLIRGRTVESDAPVVACDGGQVETDESDDDDDDDGYDCFLCGRTFDDLLVMSRHARLTCPERPENSDAPEPADYSDVEDSGRTERADFGGGESSGVEDL